MKKIIILLLTFLYVAFFFLNIEGQSIPKKQSIDKAFLKYNRDEAIKYASKYWYQINPDFVFMGKGGIYGSLGGGDCANFTSQIFINGGIRNLGDGYSIKKSTGGTVIKGAKELTARLIGKYWYLTANLTNGNVSAPKIQNLSYPKLDGSEFINEAGPSNPVSSSHLNNMQKGDPIFMTRGHKHKGSGLYF